MRKFTQLYNMISREWTGIASGMDRVKSRIHACLPVLTMLALLMVCLFGVNEKAWGNTLSVVDRDFDGKRTSNTIVTLGGNHVSFTLEGSTEGYHTQYIDLWWRNAGIQLASSLSNGSSKSFTFKWAKNDGCALTINSIRVVGTIPDYDGGYVNLGGATSSKGKSFDVTKNNVTGNSLSFTCYSQAGTYKSWGQTKNRSTDFNLTQVVINYTITPDAPGVSPTTETVNVTLPANTANPTTINYKDNFSTSDHYGSYFDYAFDSNPNNKGVMSGDNFYATEAGTYKIHAKINALDNCHTESEWSDDLTITVNRLDPTLTYTNGTVDVSVNTSTDKCSLNLNDLKTAYTGNGTISYDFTDGKDHTNGTISGSTFYATEADKTYYITATSTQTGQYAGKTANFTVTVNKRTPTFSWWNENGGTHIYSGDVLSNVAQAKYNGNNVGGLTYHYSSSNTTVAVVDGTNIRIPKTGFTSAGTTTITVTTDETTYYKAGEATHDYYIEPKATPLFKLNGADLPESPIAELHLLIGETANMTFENTDESNGQFTYPTNPERVKYTHDSEHHSGVIEGKAAGNEYIQFQQTGTTTIFGHTRSIHVFVNKHPVEISTTMNAGTWKVDSIYDGTLYSLSATPEGEESAQNDVTISSGNKNVIDFVDGHWKAVGAGTSVMTFAMKNNDYWTGDTITATITVEKYTPVISWNMESSYAWGTKILTPVSSTCELPFTLTSSDPAKANYVDGKIEVYNNNGNVTFTLTQTGNYKWNDASSNLSYTFSCFMPDNHVPFTLGVSNYKNYQSAISGAGWSSPGFYLGDGGWGTEDDYVIIHFIGVPQTLSFDKTLETSFGQLPGTHLCQVYESADGANWGNAIWEHDERVAEKNGNSVNLKPSTQYIKFAYHGTVYCDYKNIRVTERKEIVAPASVTFPTNSVDATANTQTINVNWYNVKHSTVTITGPNASFFTLADDSHEIASAIDEYGTKALKVTYAYPEGGTHTATLHIESGDGHTADVTLSATSNKLTPAITWKENLTPMSRGNNVGNPATSPVTLVYESSDPTVVKVEGDTLKPLKKGNATITASFDGTTDKKYNSNSNTIDVLVTDMKVLHINWPQTFTRLKYSTEKPAKTTADFELTATVSYFDPDTKEEISIDRDVTFTSNNNAVVQVLPGNMLHVAGLGTTTLTAHVDGVENEFIEANVTRAVKVREPSTDCDTYILEDAHNSMLTTTDSWTGDSTIYDLNGEPGYLTFSAWTEKWYLGWLGIDPKGDLKVAQYIDGAWSDAIWSNGLQIGNEQSFGPIALDRRATKIKFYKEVGSTCYHNFSEGYITLARYVELENTPNMTTLDLNFSIEDAKPGVPAVKTFIVNYSNITDQLVLDYEGSDKFTVLSPSSIGEECGDKGTATVQVQFLSQDVDHYEGTLTIHNENQSVTINLSADVDKHAQQIDWTPETLSLNTTDNVTFDATTSGSAAGLSVTYVVTNGDAATVNAETGKLTIIKDGEVTIEARADGDGVTYYDATPVSQTFTISKVTPEITTNPTAATMTMPNTNLGSCGLTGGLATVAGSFAWADNTINAVLNNEGYTVVFTPENTNWYNTVNCTVVVPVNKQVNEITWNFNVAEMYCNADYTFDAYATSGLDVRYETSDNQVAYVDGNNHLSIIKGGEVTITAYVDEDENWAAAEPVSKTFTILRFTPEIITLPTASSILIGQLLDNASLTEGLAELNGAKVDGGFAWVDGHTTTMNIAGEFTKDIVFNPSNTNWYEPVYGTMTVVVEKYAPTILTNTLTASSIEFPNPLSTSVLSGTVTAEDQVKYPSVPVTGHVEWKTPTTILRPGMQTATAWFVPDNGDWYENVEIPVSVQVTGGYVFNGDNTIWTEANNWAGNLVPTGIDDPVLINEDVDITTSVTVGSLTIKEGVDVVIKDGGVLTIGNDDSETRTAYGNLHVENGGKVIFGEGKVMVNDFTLDAQLGNISTASASGQASGAEKLNVNGDAYFQLALDPSGRISYGWYDFVVPFEVEVIGGISVAEIPDMQMKFNVNYAVMDYTEAKRAVNGKYWNKFSGTLIPGRAYTITLDDVYDWNTVVFKKKKGSSIVSSSDFTADYSGLGADNRDNGWNGFGNGTLHHTELAVDDETLIQLYDHSNKCYQSRLAKDQTIAVGVSFFMQVPEVQTITLEPAVGNTSFLAPSRDRHASDKFRLALTNEGVEQADDYLWVSADADATGEYVIGRDVLKMGTMNESKVARMWSERNGMNLCSNEMTLSNSTATCPLNIYAPNEGQYTISVEAAPENTMLYLTYNGRAIWNLTYSPYALDLTKGTTEGYGLKMYVQQVTTDIENGELLNGENGVRKVLIDDVIYIITPEGKMYDITGKGVNY